ncbi:MAG: hypothetical protein QG553_347 [Patescibacteria group bacterium]|nr:hypothetical protein [Patescibacteria group bacterium]
MSKPPKAKDRDAQLGRMLVNIYETGYMDRNTMYKMSFLKGMAAGFGGVIGATIVVALLLWILTLFSQVPLIGHFTEKVTQTVEQAK